jgi:hypothetical protein
MKKRNGNFVCIIPDKFNDQLKKEIDIISENIKKMYPDCQIEIGFEEDKMAEIKIYYNLKPVNFKVKGEGEYMVKENPYFYIKIYNEYGYANDPFVSKDYESKENQLAIWVGINNFKFRPRYKKEFTTWKPDKHFDYAYNMDTLYNDTIVPALKQFDSIIGTL